MMLPLVVFFWVIFEGVGRESHLSDVITLKPVVDNSEANSLMMGKSISLCWILDLLAAVEYWHCYLGLS